MSKQSSLDEENYDGFSTPVNTSHRGASLPPTPTKTPKILTKMASQNKVFNSLPPTPGRQLPKPNLSRGAKMRRNSVVKRTNSADCKDDYYDYYDNGVYPQSSSLNEKEMFKVDFNYAYISSTDNLQEQEVLTVPTDYKDTVKVTEIFPDHTPYNQDTYYPSQEDDYEDQTLQRKKLLGRRDPTNLMPQSTDSLESRDAELQDSFETAISSISSSIYQQQKQAEVAEEQREAVNNKRDQAEVLPTARTPNRGYLTQQESVDSTYYQDKLQDQYNQSTEFLEDVGQEVSLHIFSVRLINILYTWRLNLKFII